MNGQRYRVVAIGEKSPNMMSEITKELFDYGCEIETISSLRLGHCFVVVIMIDTYIKEYAIRQSLQAVVEKYTIQLTINQCTREKFKFVKSDAFIRIKGTHTPGITASVIKKFTDAGLDIHGLESDVFDNEGTDIFISNIKGQATNKIESLTKVAEKLKRRDLNVTVATDWQLLA